MESTFIDFYTMTKIQQKTLSKTVSENYPPFTTFKFRDAEGYVKRTIDYFFLAENEFQKKNKMIVEEMLDIDEKDIIDPEMANPPSDHYSLAYKVKFY